MTFFPVRAATRCGCLLLVLAAAPLLRAFEPQPRTFILDPRFVSQVRSDEQTAPWWTPALLGGPRLALASEGRIIVSGSLLGPAGAAHQLARLNTDGSLDQSFRPDDSLGEVSAMAADREGNIFLGVWSAAQGLAIVCLNSEGATLWSCSLEPPSSRRGGISSLTFRRDGKIAAAMNFSTAAGVEQNSIVLIDPGGKRNMGFDLALNGPVHCLEAAPDGSLLIGGDFTEVGGIRRMRLAWVELDGTVNLNFDPRESFTAPVTSIRLTGDGLILVSGRFNKVNGAPRDRFVRLKSDGSLDQDFEPVALDEPAARIVLDGARRILLAGAFNNVNGQARRRLARLLSNGSLDSTYDPGDGPNSVVRDLVIDTAGNYIISGGFNKVGHRGAPGIARLFSDSSLRMIDFTDEVFLTSEQYGATGIHLQRFGESTGALTARIRLIPGANPALAEFKPFETEVRFAPGETFKVLEIPLANDGLVEPAEIVPISCEVPSAGLETRSSIQIADDEIPVLLTGTFGPVHPQIFSRTVSYANGRIAVGGWLGFGSPNFTSQPGLVVLREDGSLDPGFRIVPVGDSGDIRVEAVAWTAAGKLLAGGYFSFIGNLPQKNLARMNPDGTLDQTFIPNVPGVQHLLALPDGKILLSPGTTSAVMRLQADGQFDPSFQPELPNGQVSTMALQTDGKILLSGYHLGLTRLLPNGAVDPEFLRFSDFEAPLVNRLVLAPDGKILIAGRFNAVHNVRRPGLARLKSDGALDPTFDPRESRISSEVPILFQRSDGKILVGGNGTLQCLNADGSVDGSLVVPTSGPTLQPLVELASGEILMNAQAASGPEIFNGLAILARTNTGLSRVVVEGAPISIREGDPLRQVQIRRIGDISQRQTVTVSLSGKGAASDNLTISTSEILFEPMQTAASLSIGAKADPFIENEEHFRLEFSTPGAATSASDLFVVDANGRPGSVTIYPGLLENRDWLMMAPGADDSILLGDFLSQGLRRVSSLTGKIEAVALPETREFSVRGMAPWDNTLLVGCRVRISDRFVARLFRLQADGQADPAFSSPNFYVEPSFILPQPDGKIAVAGDYLPTASDPGTFILLNANGTIHRTFKRVHYVYNKPAILNGKLWHVVRSSEVNGIVDRIHVHDLATDTELGSPILVEGYGRGILRDGDSLLVYGDFTAVAGVRRTGLVRLQSGIPDANFQPQILPPQVTDLILDAHGRIVIIGAFTQVNGVNRRTMARLFRDGSLDRSFEPDESLSVQQQYYPHSIVQLQNGLYAAVLSRLGIGVIELGWIRGDLPFSGNLHRGSQHDLINLVFNTIPGKSYRIESSNDFAAWRPMLHTNAAGFQVWLNSSLDTAARFYRAQQLP
jgi:uncharacterized delta-60 repeat protein